LIATCLALSAFADPARSADFASRRYPSDMLRIEEAPVPAAEISIERPPAPQAVAPQAVAPQAVAPQAVAPQAVAIARPVTPLPPAAPSPQSQGELARPYPIASGKPYVPHLASYGSAASAEEGWRRISRMGNTAGLVPVVRAVDIPGRGRMYRLYADGDERGLTALCDALRKAAVTCVYHGRKGWRR
jgi:hypothetical protein